MVIWYFADRKIKTIKIKNKKQTVKYTWTPLRNSGTTRAFDLKFSPVIGLDHLSQCAKFQFGHLRGWYFTDRSVFYPKRSLSA